MRCQVRGGFVCDEMGMGKTAVCTALVLARPFSAPTDPDTTPTTAAAAASSAASASSASCAATAQAAATAQVGSAPPLRPVKREAWGSDSAAPLLPVKHEEASGSVSGSGPGSASASASAPRLRTLQGRRLKTTLVVAPNTLIGQWCVRARVRVRVAARRGPVVVRRAGWA